MTGTLCLHFGWVMLISSIIVGLACFLVAPWTSAGDHV